MITVSDLSWTYTAASTYSLRDINFEIAAGEMVAPCRASGSGKSTPAKEIKRIGAALPRRRTHRIDDRCRSHSGQLRTGGDRRRTGTVLQHPRRQFFTITVIDEVSFALENLGAPVHETTGRLAETLDRAGITHLAERELASLSGGQQRRVAIAAAQGYGSRCHRAAAGALAPARGMATALDHGGGSDRGPGNDPSRAQVVDRARVAVAETLRLFES